MEQILMTKENNVHTGDLWFNPSDPEKLVQFKQNKWEEISDDKMQWPTPKLSDKQKNMLQVANYKQQLAELETQFWFNGLPTKEYIVRFDGIKKRIQELEQEND
tara:strand:- start:155 stop:466 length:312 start_codon:yes stop_codon:yes gene_type:complete